MSEKAGVGINTALRIASASVTLVLIYIYVSTPPYLRRLESVSTLL